MRVLAVHGGKLFAGNGYLEDRPGPEGFQGAQILVQDAPSARWLVDQTFDERMPSRRPRNLAVSALGEVSFTTDWQGVLLPKPVSLLLASFWDLTGATRVFARDDATAQWSAVTLAQDPVNVQFLAQIRSFGEHRDSVTGIDLAFAGQDPRGIFRGSYDATLPGHQSLASRMFQRPDCPDAAGQDHLARSHDLPRLALTVVPDAGGGRAARRHG